MYLVIGCGYIGAKVAALLHAQGAPVSAATHSEQSAIQLRKQFPFPIVSGDVGDDSSLQNLLRPLPDSPRWVIHCASSNRGGAAAYRHVFVQGCINLTAHLPHSRLIFTSSSSVYPQTDGSWVDETSPANPSQETGRLLREAEEIVLQQGGCVARLSGIYGPGRSFILKQFLEGNAAIEGTDDHGRWLNQIHRDDAALALIHLMQSQAQGIYNITDVCPMTQRTCFEQLSTRFQRNMPPQIPPNPNRKRAWTHKRVSSRKLHDTGFTWRYPNYLDALEQDTGLVPSILAQIQMPADRHTTTATGNEP